MVFNQDFIHNVFNNVHKKYDLMNDLMSFGLHRKWKKYFAKLVIKNTSLNDLIWDRVFDEIQDLSVPDYRKFNSESSLDLNYRTLNSESSLENNLSYRPNIKILDMSSGTCDIPIAIIKELRNALENLHPESFELFKDGKQSKSISFYCIDPCEKMLIIGKQKLNNACILLEHFLESENIFLCHDSLNLPFQDNNFDLYTISFGLRNITEKLEAINEAFRVLKPGGSFFCMEFGKPSFYLRPFYNQYTRYITFLGDKVAKDKSSYEYLVQSIEEFPDPSKIIKMMKEAGFLEVKYQNIYDIINIYTGKKVS